MTNKKNAIVILSIIMTVIMIPTSVFASNNLDTINDDIIEDDYIEYKINKELDQMIMQIKDETKKQKIIDFFYTPAYYEENEYDGNISLKSDILTINKNVEDEFLKIGKVLVNLNGEDLDNAIKEQVIIGAEKILKMKNVQIQEEYINYSKDYISEQTMKNMQIKYKQGLKEIDLIENGDDEIELDESLVTPKATTSHTKTFSKSLGSPGGAAYSKWSSKATWSENGSTVTSFSATKGTITTPSFMQTTLQKNVTKRSEKKVYGYVQRGWGYVNLFYMDGKINGYFIIDGKVKVGKVVKNYLAQISPQAYNTHKWGVV